MTDAADARPIQDARTRPDRSHSSGITPDADVRHLAVALCLIAAFMVGELVAAIASGTAITLAWDMPAFRNFFPAWIAERDAIFPALFVALAAMILLSFITAPPTAEQLASLGE